jgi:hypothetical protein
MSILEIQQVLILDTPFGKEQALFIIDYGIHKNTIWVCTSLVDGKIRHYDSNQISVEINHTLNLKSKINNK